MSWYEWRPYVPVATRRRQAEQELKRRKKKGQSVAPVIIEGRTIAKSFWGKSWCANLERYSDYENRLPRGRTYVRNGSVIDLQIKKGEVLASVSGSSLYDIRIAIAPVKAGRWKSICRKHRFARGASAGPSGEGSDGPGLPGRRWAVSVTEGNRAFVQLSGLGRHVQTRCGGSLRRGRPA